MRLDHLENQSLIFSTFVFSFSTRIRYAQRLSIIFGRLDRCGKAIHFIDITSEVSQPEITRSMQGIE